MSIFKCKMCGGTIEFNPGEMVGTCDSCGSVQTLPKVNDDVITNLFNRANNLRIKAEFDKAAEIYEKILNEDDTNAEAHWCLVLCKYGIEYVEDPTTYKRVPTCHRAQYESIMTDPDYIAALENSDVTQQSIYAQQAIEISNIQKGILAIVKEEKPFDVFICYKETDETGKRTVDSALANDIYYQLTQEGLKVFYAAITLEDKLGQEYEPYIFAALNSAKVMLVVGTKPEYFEAVWVRNEWSRYLKIMKKDRSRLLIPCYRDMDAYDLPDNFAHLQAQDMSKIGFISDIVRGIKKIVHPDESASQAAFQSSQSSNASSNISELMLDNDAMYRGETFAGIPHGQGKCIYDDGSTYEGNWSKGKRQGQGTLSYPDGTSLVGEWKNDDIFNGSGTKKYSNGDYCKGEFVNGRITGIAEYHKCYDGSVYNGEFVNGKKEGKGELHIPDGSSLIGEWKDDGIWNGSGKFKFDGVNLYTGEISEGKPNGNGVCDYTNGSKYEGEFKNGKREGIGTYFYTDNTSWNGEWKDDKRCNGSGMIKYKNGAEFNGELRNGKPNGKGKYRFLNGDVYDGDFVDGNSEGYGTYFYKDGSSWSGEWKRDKKLNGTGVVKYNSGNIYSGELKNGKCEGNGVYYYTNGNRFEGEFKNNIEWSGKKILKNGNIQKFRNGKESMF